MLFCVNFQHIYCLTYPAYLLFFGLVQYRSYITFSISGISSVFSRYKVYLSQFIVVVMRVVSIAQCRVSLLLCLFPFFLEQTDFLLFSLLLFCLLIFQYYHDTIFSYYIFYYFVNIGSSVFSNFPLNFFRVLILSPLLDMSQLVFS